MASECANCARSEPNRITQKVSSCSGLFNHNQNAVYSPSCHACFAAFCRPRRHLTAGTFLCHNCLRTLRQKWPLQRIRNTGERHQKAPQNKIKQNKPATRFTCNLYRLMPRLRLPLRFTALHNLSFPIRIRLIHVPSRTVYCHVHLCDTNMKQNTAHSIHLVFLRSSDNNTTTYVHQQTALH